ncbi:MAG: mechanosensitive ion channel [Coriobacteriaceae bacterium]|nr:mechanosensitive ion channel [Coriobacteriaceae bacterium]
MSRTLKIKIVLLIVVAVASMAVMGVLLSTMQTNLYLDNYTEEIQEELADLPDRIGSADASVAETTRSFDETCQTLVGSIGFMAHNNAGFKATNAKMREYKDLLDVDNVLVVTKGGKIVAQAQDTLADFSSSRFNQLRTVFDDGKPSEAVEIEVPDKDWLMRYYAAQIDDNTMAVIEKDPTELRELIADAGSTASVVEDITVGQSGFIFSISSRDYLVEYYPDASLINTDALVHGVPVEDLEEGNLSWMNIDGQRYYCGVTQIDNMYYVAAIPESDMTSARNITVGIILFAFLAVMLVVIMYGIFAMREDERENSVSTETDEELQEVRTSHFNRPLARKAAVLSLVGFILILVVSFYMQTLFALSSESVANNERIKETVASMETSLDRVETLNDQYGERYLPTCRIAAYILDQNPSLENHESLVKLADVLQTENILVYDASGTMTATSSAIVTEHLSDDPDDPSYDFTLLLHGEVDSVVQDPQTDENSGEIWQYIGVPLHDASGKVDGIVQVAVRPAFLESLLETAQIDTVLEGVKSGSDGFAFAVNRDDDTFAYYPDPLLIGESVFDFGMTERELKDGYCDYLTIDGTTYYASSAETDNYYFYIATTEDELMDERVPLTLVVGAVALVCLLIVFFLLSFGPKRKIRIYGAGDPDAGGSGRIIDVELPGGRTVRTDSAASRWLNSSFAWNERTAWQKTSSILRWVLGIFVVFVFILVIFQDQIFASDSIFAYILGGNWEHGLNIFAITACIMFICVAVTLVVVIEWLLSLLGGVLNARGETICRLLRSFIKYATAIGMIYYCLVLIGIDTTTLLASAGILSIAISLGARELVGDIISGLFIIFEGEFRVGDIIKVDDWRGTVMEIGIRTIKIEDAAQNIKIIRNSDVNDVINMTKKYSYLSIEVGIDYDESIERVENILAEELPKIGERLPAIIKGPYYRGVVAFEDSAVMLRIAVQCEEKDRPQLERDLNREMKLLFDDHEIDIPFPQIVVNTPTEHTKATEYEKYRAELFNEEQKEASKGFDENERTSNDDD